LLELRFRLSDLIDIFLCHFRARLPEFSAASNRIQIPAVKSRHTVIVLLMSALDDVQVGEWLAIVSTVKGSSYILQQVTSMTSGLVGRGTIHFAETGAGPTDRTLLP
jgi:hypothetical protein